MKESGLDLCQKAFDRLKAGKPNNKKFIGMPITPSVVSQEAGWDAGYLKRDRIIHGPLIIEIDDFSKLQKSKLARLQSKLDKANSEKEQEKNKAESFEKKYKASLAREFMLTEKIFELEKKMNNRVWKL
jgi:hypothetical protein